MWSSSGSSLVCRSGERPLKQGLPTWLSGKESAQQMSIWSLGWEDPLEEGIVAHSGILAEITKIYSVGSQRADMTQHPRHSHFWSRLMQEKKSKLGRQSTLLPLVRSHLGVSSLYDVCLMRNHSIWWIQILLFVKSGEWGVVVWGKLMRSRVMPVFEV